MKCKIVLILMCTVLFVAGCSAPTKTNTEVSSSSSEEKLTVFKSFERVLTDKGLSYEKITMAAEMVGAEQGIKYETEYGDVEIYRFDKSTESYINAEESQSLYLDGFGAFEAVVENGYAIMSDDEELVNEFLKIITD